MPARRPRQAVAAEVGTQGLADHRGLLGQVDAVSIVTPTAAHFPIAREFLESGAHVLVEKPITETPAEARELIALAARQRRILQVGHLERFNSAILGAEEHLRAPRFIECHRLAPYKERGTDVSVVLDLMIHDIDIVQTLVGSRRSNPSTPSARRCSPRTWTSPMRGSASPTAAWPMPRRVA